MPTVFIAILSIGSLISLLGGPAMAQIHLTVAAIDEQEVETVLQWERMTPGSSADTDSASSGQLKLHAPWQGALVLDGIELHEGGVWRIEARAVDYWSPPIRVDPSKANIVTVQLIPTKKLRGRLEFGEDDGHSPSDLQAWVNRSQAGAEKKPHWEVVGCDLFGVEFVCQVPMDTLDLKLSSTGHVPIYRWDLEMSESLGEIRMYRGASFGGWVVADGGEGGISLALVPRTIGWEGRASERIRRNLRALTVEASEEGFFLIGPVPPGGYDLEVSRKGLPGLRIEDLDLTGEKEVFHSEVIELVPAPGLDLYLTPPVNPEQQPWEVVLMQPRSNSNVVKTLHRAAAGFDGHWHLDAVPSGEYRFEVRDHRGATWLVRELTLEQLREPLFFELDSVAVEGTLSIGDEPLDGTVIFGTRDRRPNVYMKAAGGKFAGILPREGVWKIEVEIGGFATMAEPVSIARLASGSAAPVEIKLPDTVLEGEVRWGSEPASEAFVSVYEAGDSSGKRPKRTVRLRTDEEGKFEVRGLQPGTLQVSAYLGVFDPASDWIAVEIQEGFETPYFKLQLYEKVDFRVRVISSQGPVAGASVYVVGGPSAALNWPAEAISDAQGIVHLRLPKKNQGQRMVFITVAAGYGVSIQEIALAEGQEPLIALSPQKGDLALWYTFGTLFHGGSGVQVSTLLTPLISANRFSVAPDYGVILRGMAVGEYSQCLGIFERETCEVGVLTPSGDLKLRLNDPELHKLLEESQ